MADQKLCLLLGNNFDTQRAVTAALPYRIMQWIENTALVLRVSYELHQLEIDTDRQFCLFTNE